MDATETKVCRQCGKLLPLSGFRSTRWGGKTDVCNACIAEKRADTHYNRAHVGGCGQAPFSDPDFDNLSVGEVWRLMCRAKKWLESRGCVITLDGEFREVRVRKLKKE